MSGECTSPFAKVAAVGAGDASREALSLAKTSANSNPLAPCSETYLQKRSQKNSGHNSAEDEPSIWNHVQIWPHRPVRISSPRSSQLARHDVLVVLFVGIRWKFAVDDGLQAPLKRNNRHMPTNSTMYSLQGPRANPTHEVDRRRNFRGRLGRKKSRLALNNTSIRGGKDILPSRCLKTRLQRAGDAALDSTATEHLAPLRKGVGLATCVRKHGSRNRWTCLS
jgi:hypothetical protein